MSDDVRYALTVSPRIVTQRETEPCCEPMLASPLDERDATDLAALFKALADPARLRLISLIAAAPGGEACACDLTAPLGRSQPTVSHHLGQLVAAGLLERQQRGRWAWFRINPYRFDAVRRALAPIEASQLR